MTDTAAPSSPTSSKRWKRIGITAGVLAAVWTAGAGWWLPRWVKPQIEAAGSKALNTPVLVDGFSFSPWTLTARIDGLRVGPAKAEFFKLQQAEVRVSLQSLWRLAPVVSRVTLTQPQVFLERIEAQRFNISPVLDHLNAQPKQPDSKPVNFAVHNIRIVDGQIRYLDHVLDPSHPEDHLVSALNVGVPFVSNLPSDVEVDVQPLLEAKIDGSPLRVTGTTQPFDKDLHSNIEISWTAIDLAYWAQATRPLLPPDLRVDVARGQLDTHIRVAFEQHPAPAVSTLKISGEAKVSGLDAKWPQQALAWRWKALDITGIEAMPLERKAGVDSVALSGLEVEAGPRPAAAATPAAPKKPPAEPASAASSAAAKPAAAEKPWTWRVSKIDLGATAIQVEPTAGHKLPALGPLSLQLAGLDSNPSAAPAKLQFNVADEHQGQIKLSGSLQPAQRTGALDLAIEQLQPGPWMAPFADALPAKVSAGTVNFHSHIQLDPQSLALTQGQLEVAGLESAAMERSSKDAEPDHLHLPKLTAGSLQALVKMSDAGTYLESAKLDKLSVEQLDVTVTRTADGRILWAKPAAVKAAEVRADKRAAALPTPKVDLGELLCKACNFSVNDYSTGQVSAYSLLKSDIKLSSLSSDLSHTSQFDISGTGQHSGTLQLSGDVRPQPLKLQSKVVLKSIDVRGFQPYVDPYLNLTIESAKVQADGNVGLEANASGDDLAVRYKGRVGLTELRTHDRITNAEFLRWKSFSIDGLSVDLNKGALTADLGKVALRDFYARLILNPDGKMNVAQITRAKGEAATSITTPNAPGQKATAASAPAPAASASAAASGANSSNKLPPNMRWTSITLAGGRVDFTDTFIKPNYSARLTQINGNVSAVSSNKPEPADLKITGKVDDAAPLDISGRIHPLGARLTTDITASAKGIEMTRFSPYAARYAGYAIEKGTLSVNVNYKINNGLLEATNNVYLDQLTFGDKVDSPDATKLPVLFAVSLLKDSHGVIDVNLPISGSLDDPEFSIGGIILKVIGNLLTKAVTSPFSLLSGGGDQELGFVAFAPGSSRLDEESTKRLDTLVKALNEHSSLKLEVTGYADPAFDVDGLKKRHVNRLMRQAKAQAIGVDVGDVTIADDERARWLEAAYKAADVKKPRNVVGIAKSLPPAEMEAILEASTATDSDALTQLANRRADSVKAYLGNKLSADRIRLTSSKITPPKDSDKGPTTRAQFSIN